MQKLVETVTFYRRDKSWFFGSSRFAILTPKALANSSPGLERSDNPGICNSISLLTLKGFAKRRTLSGFNSLLSLRTQGSRCAPTLGSS